ncbi:MAG: hypothetical protein HUU49_01940 [Candidatus Buchananbacteria bacterium]|nr:hypothetical protein [Candidatus Buchananbacteria bacterium]
MKRSSITHLLIILFATAIAGAVPFLFLEDLSKNFGPVSELQTNVAAAINTAVAQTDKIIHAPAPLINNQPSTDGSNLTTTGILKWTNTHRQEQGVLPLKLNVTLNQAATAKLEDMFANQYFEHISPEGLGPDHWVDQSGYEYISIGENLALGSYDGDQDLVAAWMNSPGHRENILNQSFQEIGIAAKKGIYQGAETWLAVQVFAKPLSSCPQVDQTLHTKIEQNKTQLASWDEQILELQVTMEQNRPKGRSNQEEIDYYNSLVKQYNELAKNYNTLTDQTKKLVEQYNAQVAAFNSCAEQ